MSLLSVRSVSKKYDKSDFEVFNGLDLDLDAGEIFAVIGPNGSGKSTLLKIIAGLLEKDKGEVTIEGHEVLGPDKQLVAGHEEIKLVFQDFGLKPGMSVYENIRYQLLDFTAEYQQERIEEVLSLCDLTDLKERKPREISGGQQQRVALANALSTDPKVLLMDEPFSNLDPFTKVEILEALKRIAKKTLTAIIIVTHDPLDSLMLSDKIGFLDHGHFVQVDSPERIYKEPVNLKIGQFFGYISLLGEDILRRIKVNTSPETKYAIRAEKVSINDKEGIEATIRSIAWKGHYSLLFLAMKGQDNSIIALGDQNHKVGEKIFIGFEPADIISFS